MGCVIKNKLSLFSWGICNANVRVHDHTKQQSENIFKGTLEQLTCPPGKTNTTVSQSLRPALLTWPMTEPD